MNQTTNGNTTSLNASKDGLCSPFEDSNGSCDVISSYNLSNHVPVKFGIFATLVAINCVLTPLIALIGVFGNVLTLAVLKKEKRVTTMLCLQKIVTVCDLMFLISLFPFSFYICGHYLYQELIEKLTAYVPSYFTSLIARSLMQSGRVSIALLATERAIAICFPLSMFITIRRTYTTLALMNCMILGNLVHDLAVFSLAHDKVMGSGGYGKINMFSVIFEGRVMASRINKSYVAIFKSVSKAIFEILPVFLVGFCNLAINRCLAKSAKLELEMQGDFARARKEQHTKINKTLFIITCSFVLLCLPGDLYALFIFFLSNNQSGIYILLSFYVNILMTVNHAINFFIYCFSNQKYRKMYMEIICCKKAESLDRSNRKRMSTYTVSTLKEQDLVTSHPTIII